MRIGTVTARRDGKFLVTILCDHGTIRRKVYTAEQLADACAEIEEQCAQELEYYANWKVNAEAQAERSESEWRGNAGRRFGAAAGSALLIILSYAF